MPALAMHVRTYATYRELLTFFLNLTFVNAREKSQTIAPYEGESAFAFDLAALARRVEEQPERFGIQGDADA
jgi:hypothetical protein